jgi:hypothetical protein
MNEKTEKIKNSKSMNQELIKNNEIMLKALELSKKEIQKLVE